MNSQNICGKNIQFGNGLIVAIKTKKVKSPKKEKEVEKVVIQEEEDIVEDLQKLETEVKAHQQEILKKISSGFCPWSLDSIKKTQQEAKHSLIEVQVEEKKKNTDMYHKSRFCNHFLADQECPLGLTCSFAHNESEIHPLQCRHGEDCRNICRSTFNTYKKVCYFQHPNEDVKEYCDRILFAKRTRCTKMCEDVVYGNSCSSEICGFAHTLEEFRPRECKFDTRCRNENCKFIHSHEDKQQYLDRLYN